MRRSRPPIQQNIPELVILTGSPGVGKTTLARALVRFALRVGAGRTMVHIPVDELRAMIQQPGKIDHAAERELWLPMLQGQLRALCKCQSPEVGLIVVDGLFYNREDIDRLRKQWPELFFFHFHLSLPLEVCLKRNARRKGVARLKDAEVRRLHALPVPERALLVELTGKERPIDLAERTLGQVILSGRCGP